MSSSRICSPIRSSGPSKAGVAKRGRPADISFLKATAISIFISDMGLEMVKYSRYQRLLRAYIVDPDNSSSCSGYTKDKVKCDSVSLTPDGTLRLSRQIREAEAKRERARTARRRQLDALLEAEATLEGAERQEALLKNRGSELGRRGLES